ncbi:MAG: hypothetical protein ACX94A_09225, partial [Algiphilus sp.]
EPVVDWLTALAEGRPPAAPLRLPFLHWLANEYVIPGSHTAPGASHFLRVRARFAAVAAESRAHPAIWAAAA